jgi:hypothetical protein
LSASSANCRKSGHADPDRRSSKQKRGRDPNRFTPVYEKELGGHNESRRRVNQYCFQELRLASPTRETARMLPMLHREGNAANSVKSTNVFHEVLRIGGVHDNVAFHQAEVWEPAEGSMLGNRTWDEWVSQYAQSHTNPVNRACHTVGIPLIVLSLLLGVASLLGLRLWRPAAILFAIGWILQFLGHWFERKPPEFFKDWRFLLVGVRWWVAKVRGRV